MAAYKPYILSSRLWLTMLALCYCAAEASASTVIVINKGSQRECYDQHNNRITCPPQSKKNRLIGIIIFAVVSGILVLCGLLYCFCAGARCCIACCLCCSKRKKTSGGEVYQVLPEQGNSSTLPQSTYTPNTLSYNYGTPGTDTPYDPPTYAPPPTQPAVFVEPPPNDKYDNYGAGGAPHGTGGGEAASYYNNLPELKYEYNTSASSSKVSLPQTGVPSYQPPSYPPSMHG